ncbi:MAG: 2-C-methyl-D-erythritol 4-phosphate cytidylyltransferase [Candidatus Krumholzibacteria bacterium]|nr:2-C-methyl-D-erythritol 4-phosphate cytidylyltransferase [Candidatus Krumholzibacteria bacterium]
MHVVALIMAGGAGERFGTKTPKQLTVLAGRPMLAWSAGVFARSTRVSWIVLVGPAAQERALRAVLTADADAKLHAFAAGGPTRQQSVSNGLAAVPDGTTHVLIHDAARPCVSETLCERVIDALAVSDAVVPVVPATDTLVQVRDSRVEIMVDRAAIAGVQTPQGFRHDLVMKAHREAKARGFESSDDGSLVLAMGAPVVTVPGERSNLKVTYKEDIGIAEAILQGRSIS